MRRIPFAIGAVLIGAGIGLAVVQAIGGLKRHAAGDQACGGAVELARKLAPLAQGEVAALTMAAAPLQVPDLAFEDADGKPWKLSDWRGRTVLVNLWATWCVPCRKEMPALEGLQTRLGGKDFEVVAINKLSTAQPVTIQIASAPALHTATLYNLVPGSAAVVAATGAAPAVTCACNACSLTFTMPATSATTVVLR